MVKLCAKRLPGTTDSHSSDIEEAIPTSVKPNALANAPMIKATLRPIWSERAPTKGEPKRPSAEDAEVIVPTHMASHPA